MTSSLYLGKVDNCNCVLRTRRDSDVNMDVVSLRLCCLSASCGGQAPILRCVLVRDRVCSGKHGTNTIYVPRSMDDLEDQDQLKREADGGEVGEAVSSLEELTALL